MSGQVEKPVTWVLVADAEHARVVVPDGVKGRFRTEPGFAEKLGHFHHHGPAPKADPHAAQKHVFAQLVAQQINDAVRHGAFGRLVLVAGGHVLHDLRECLSHDARSKVVAAVAKDYAKLSDHDLSPHLAEWWVEPEAVEA